MAKTGMSAPFFVVEQAGLEARGKAILRSIFLVLFRGEETLIYPREKVALMGSDVPFGSMLLHHFLLSTFLNVLLGVLCFGLLSALVYGVDRGSEG